MGRTFQRLEVFGSLSVYDNVLVAADLHRSRNTGPVDGVNGERVDASATAAEILQRLGVDVRCGVRVTKVDPDGVWIGTEQIRASTVLWSAGISM